MLPRLRTWRITVALTGTDARNGWDIWVYPKPAPAPAPTGVLVTSAFDAAEAALNQGRRVVLLAPADAKGPGLLPMRFLPVFWSNGFFHNQPGTMGILCDLCSIRRWLRFPPPAMPTGNTGSLPKTPTPSSWTMRRLPFVPSSR